MVEEGEDVDLGRLPVQTCWPGDVGPLITWGLTVTRGPNKERQNLGIYRQQVIGRNKVIMRWLSHRGGALDYREWCQKHPGQPYPVAVALGADPATILGAVTPVPDTLSEYAFAGLLRGHRTELVKCRGSDLQVPASAEIVLEGVIHPGEMADEGPYGDHTGYYNEVDRFPVFTVERVTRRQKPIYHSTYTGRPPDEPAILGVALNEVFVPILQKQFPEIVDFYLPPEGCSYRMAVVTMKKQYPGHAKRVMLGVWSFLRQFMYTKFVIVTDDDIDARDWNDVIWAITTRMDPKRDTVMIDNTPIDYLDFASPVSGLGSKMGLDATHKWPGETSREWGAPSSGRSGDTAHRRALVEPRDRLMRIVLQPSGACLELLPGNASSMAPGGLATTVRRAAATATAISARRCWWRGGYAKTARYAIMANSSPASPSRWKTACCIGTGCWRRVNCLCAS